MANNGTVPNSELCSPMVKDSNGLHAVFQQFAKGLSEHSKSVVGRMASKVFNSFEEFTHDLDKKIPKLAISCMQLLIALLNSQLKHNPPRLRAYNSTLAPGFFSRGRSVQGDLPMSTRNSQPNNLKVMRADLRFASKKTTCAPKSQSSVKKEAKTPTGTSHTPFAFSSKDLYSERCKRKLNNSKADSSPFSTEFRANKRNSFTDNKLPSSAALSNRLHESFNQFKNGLEARDN
eukprot:TRINITY_DN7014_c0_g2_i2.p1 TRINITY_DN7014_c0_g2~~TRINITY_DN7014_c0_g2_i2.p1  ORF type:complete len:233 (+),score=28.06 TRINITY_DN7014_c0_g2_i2:607-1305(+)